MLCPEVTANKNLQDQLSTSTSIDVDMNLQIVANDRYNQMSWDARYTWCQFNSIQSWMEQEQLLQNITCCLPFRLKNTPNDYRCWSRSLWELVTFHHLRERRCETRHHRIYQSYVEKGGTPMLANTTTKSCRKFRGETISYRRTMQWQGDLWTSPQINSHHTSKIDWGWDLRRRIQE